MSALASMTGFADASEVTTLGTLSVELKSVNSRFLELHIRLPDEVRMAEAGIRERLQSALTRGKVECRVALTRSAQTEEAQLNANALAQLGRLASQVSASIPGASAIGIGDILRWPGVIHTPEAPAEIWRAALWSALDNAIALLCHAREREGKALAVLLTERCEQILTIIAGLRTQLPQIQAELERRLRERLSHSAADAAESAGMSPQELQERIRQEIGIHGIRTDIAEEMDRLSTHVNEVKRVLQTGGAVGRRLDFLLQELNREANTIGSKASGIDITNAAVELKIRIEQIREQIQNLE